MYLGYSGRLWLTQGLGSSCQGFLGPLKNSAMFASWEDDGGPKEPPALCLACADSVARHGGEGGALRLGLGGLPLICWDFYLGW